MRSTTTISALLAILLAVFCIECGAGWEVVRPQAPPRAVKTRSLSGGFATDGRNGTNEMVLMLMRVGLLGGYAVRRLKAFNDRIYLARYRRSYWFGTRYYALDNRYFLETRDTCAYRMNETERADVEYEEGGEPILDVIYQYVQCQRRAEYCCGLDCCSNRRKRMARGIGNLDLGLARWE